MTKNRTNQLLEDMRLAGVVVLDGLYDRLTVNEMSIAGQFEQQTPYTFTAALEEDSLNNFVVVADGVPFDVCLSIKDKKPNWAETVAVNGEEDVCHETENNYVSFFFNDELTDLLHDYCENNSDCGECGKCNNRRCSYGFKNKNGECFSCDASDKGIWNVDREECNKCKNRMWSSYSSGRCFVALDNVETGNWLADVPKEECEKFPNHYSINGGPCFYCKGNFDKTTGVCSTVDCNTYPSTALLGLDKDTCELCGGTFNFWWVTGGGKVGYCYGLPQ